MPRANKIPVLSLRRGLTSCIFSLYCDFDDKDKPNETDSLVFSMNSILQNYDNLVDQRFYIFVVEVRINSNTEVGKKEL